MRERMLEIKVHLVHGGLVHFGIAQSLLHGLHALAEQVHVELLEAGAGDGAVEVDALVETVNFNRRLRAGGQRALCTLAGCTKAPQRTCIAGDVLLVFALKLLHHPSHDGVRKYQVDPGHPAQQFYWQRYAITCR